MGSFVPLLFEERIDYRRPHKTVTNKTASPRLRIIRERRLILILRRQHVRLALLTLGLFDMDGAGSLQAGHSEVALVVGALDAPSLFTVVLGSEMAVEASDAEVDNLSLVSGRVVNLG